MKRIHSYFMCVMSLVAVLAGTSFAQVATGIPPFASIGGGPFDQINLGNLNVHFDIPISQKAGRGMPFTYDVTYDNSVWIPVGASGHQSWQPVSAAWGWQGLTQITSANVTYSTTTTSGHCGTMGQFTWQSWQYSNFVYYDASGTKHPISYSPSYITSTGTPSQNCPPTGPNPSTAYPVPTTDGSGYSMIAIPGQGSVSTSIGSSNGATLTAGNIEDANGNEITNNGSIYTDALGQTALTITGLGTPTSPVLLKYTSPSGAQQYKVNYVAKTVTTSFSCSGIGEYSGTVNLPTSIILADNSSYSFTYYGDGRLQEITLPTGGTITYAYTGGFNGINCSDGSTTGMTRTLSPGGQWTYTRSYTGNNNLWTTTIVDPTTPVANTTVVNLAKDSATSGNTYNFYETQRLVYQGGTGGTLLLTTYNCWNGDTGNCAFDAVSSPIAKQTAFRKLSSGSLAASALTYSGPFVTEDKEYDWGYISGQSPISDTITSYAQFSNGAVEPSSIVVEDGSGNVVAQTIYGYDETAVTATSGTPQHLSIGTSRGNLTSIKTYTSLSAYLTKTFTYYDTGTVNTATDVNGAVTTNVYGTGSCGNSFPTQVNMPLSLFTSATWDCVGGVQLTSTDVNGHITTTAYSDPYFWRPATTTDPQSNVLHYNYYNPAPPPARAETFMFFSSAIAEQLTTVDGFGRTSVVQKQQAPGVSNFDTVETDYDALGRISKTYMPYFSNSYGQTNPGGLGTTQTYDALSRPLVTTDAGGGTLTYSYSNNDVLQTVGPASTGENTKRKQLEYDGLGRLTSVCEITSGPGSGTCGQSNPQTGYWTKYTYNALGNLTQVVQNAQSSSTQTRTYAYDMLGRLTSETNPESGTSTYIYDVTGPSSCNGGETYNGDLARKVNADGTNICYYYDALHRLTDVGNSNQSASNACKRFRYDNSTGVLGARPAGVSVGNTLGRVVEAETDICTTWPITQSSIITDEWFGYDALGNTTDVYQSTPTSGGYYHTTASYYPNGVPNTLVAPVGTAPTITYNVDGEGRTSTVSSSSGQNPVTATSYNLASQVTGVTFGSGDSDSYQFDPNTGRMTQYQYKMGTLTDTGVLGWNANGSLGSLAITDQINSANSQTCSYTHDDLSRVANVNCGSAWGQTFTYDPFGNLTKSGSSAWMPGYNNNNRFTLAGTSYDSNGNLTNDATNTYAYDVNGNVITLNGTAIVYDALDRMVQEGSTSLLMGPLSSKPLASMSGQTVNERFVALPGGAMMRSSWGYRHGDWLGSVRLQTSFSQTLVYDSAYAPFGENYAGAGTHSDVAFTQGSTDSLGRLLSTSLYDFDFRKYAQAQGRWISPDPSGMAAADPTNPQSWNRYAYVMNSPLDSIDPLGLATGSGPGDPDNPPILYPCVNSVSGAIDCVFTGPYNCGPMFNEQGDFLGYPCPTNGVIVDGSRSGASDLTCTLAIQANNNAGLSAAQLQVAERQIGNLFAPVGVNFSGPGTASFTLNFTNASGRNHNLGSVAYVWFIRGSPTVFVNNIMTNFSRESPMTINNIIGTVGAHELIHKITPIGDLEFDQNNPTDLMSANKNDNRYNLYANNLFRLTPDELQKLSNACLSKQHN